jgi:molecular chaperone Hsp33
MARMTDHEETYSERTLGFSIPSRDARGRLVRLDRTVDEILSAHAYPPPIANLLGEALVLTALIGSLLKDDGSQVTMQAQTESGAVNLFVCDYRGGALRGYVDFDADALAELGANPTLYALFGKAYLALTFDMTDGRGRYQGIVPLEGESLARACEGYFVQSEQLPTLIRTSVTTGPKGSRAAGMLVQHLADGEEGRERLHVRLDHPEWEHVAVMAGSLRHDELLDPELSLEAIVWRLFHEEEEVRAARGAAIERGCRCTSEHYRSVLTRFPEAERAEMRDEEGMIVVDCAFCSRQFPIAA